MSSEVEVTVKPEAAEAPRLPEIKVRDPITITIFGATGDLAHRKLIPALYTMYRQDLLPEEFCILGYARRDWNDEEFSRRMCDAVREHSRLDVDEDALRKFAGHLCYQKGDLTEDEAYVRFRTRLEDDNRCPGNRLYYLSIKPELFDDVVARLEAHDLIAGHDEKPWTRVVIEKPFGHDLASARELNHQLLSHLHEDQIYRIDHYLGKETVQNIMSFRFANAIFEPVFNGRYVEHIQITASETVGMEGGRGGYYDATGAVRDMVQNHLLQLLCLVMMEPPSSLRAEALHNEKVKILQSIEPPGEGDLSSDTLRAQYRAGTVDGESVPGYLEEERVDPASRTETYAALKLGIDTWRWSGVPIYLRTGKRLKKRVTEIAVQFKKPPLQLFQTVECVGDVCDLTRAKPNTLIFRIQPNEGITLLFSAKRPVLQVQVENVDMEFDYADTWNRSLPEAYERLLLDVMRGDSSLFMRSDEVEAAWQIVDPILQGWANGHGGPVYKYAAGTWGPFEADEMFYGTGEVWRKP